MLDPKSICQIAVVVRDIEKAASNCAELFNLPKPQVIITDEYEKTHATYRGKPTAARAKLAFFRLGPISLELIEPIGEPSTWNDVLSEKGQSLHHIAFKVEGMDEVLGNILGDGVELVQRGDYTGGRYAYVDATEKVGFILELLEDVPIEKRERG